MIYDKKFIKKINIKLKDTLSEGRYIHSLNVADLAEKYASIYGANSKKAYLAGLVHDCAREYSLEKLLLLSKEFGIVFSDIEKNVPVLIHPLVGAEIAKKEFNIDDKEILNAIKIHTTGSCNMSVLDKVVYLADCLEPTKKYKGIEKIREVALIDLNLATLMAMNSSIEYIIYKNNLLHPLTIKGRNELIIKLKYI